MTYTLRLYRGSTLVVEHSFNIDGPMADTLKREQAVLAGAMVAEALETQESKPKEEHA